jgi:predicted small secreted protein
MNVKRQSWLALIALCFTALAACNTMEGAGEDVEDAGGAIQKGAEQNKPY